MDGLTQEINTNNGKAEVLAQGFFPKKPDHSRVPKDYEYPEPLPPPPPVMPEQITCQIRRLSLFKASGPDEIPNVILQKCLEQLLDYLVYLFRGIFELRMYYPKWQEFTMAVLRKLGKPCYIIPKAYRPIALLCTIPKVLTATVAEDVPFMIEKNMLLPDTHFGGRPGCTTTDTIHYLVYKIKATWGKKKVASVLFLDVEGPF